MARRQAGAVALTVMVVALVGACLPSAVSAKKPHVHLSSLPKALQVTSTPSEQVLQAGKGTVNVVWKPAPNVDQPAGGANVKVELCYGPESRKDRGWRKAEDDLSKDKACQFKVTDEAYASGSGSFVYTVKKDIPSGFYFVRAYVLDASGNYVAYGDAAGEFQVAGITGITTSIKVAAGVFSAFSVVSLAFFFVVENRKKNK
ncbi:hypothetical protein QOZ80_2AG0136160 [Eleusine coracana subsp. coracana]|nr:hypothetical protein QOZ80_2AG0136160 [Eleusine coracana subsp. coracana]